MGTTPTYALPYPELTDVANVPADMRELAEAVDATVRVPLTDSGWVNVTINAGFAVSAGNTPQVRKIGKLVYCRGGVAGTGMAINGAYDAMTIPVGYRALGTVNFRAGTHSGASSASMVIGTNGIVSVRTNGVMANWYLFPSTVWFID